MGNQKVSPQQIEHPTPKIRRKVVTEEINLNSLRIKVSPRLPEKLVDVGFLCFDVLKSKQILLLLLTLPLDSSFLLSNQRRKSHLHL